MPSDPGLTPLPGALPAAAPSHAAPPSPAADDHAGGPTRRIPVDGGLAALGLVTLAGAGAGVVFAIAFFVAGRTFGVGGGAGGMLPALGIFAASLVRSAFHIGAGRAATKRLPIVGEAATRYLIAAGAQTGLILLIVAFVWFDGPLSRALPTLLGLLVLLMGWPVALWVLVRGRAIQGIFKTADTFDVGLVPGDRSVGAAGVLMTVFGATFLVLDLGVVGFLVAAKVHVDTSVAMWLATLFVFAVRSSLHLGWGVAAIRGRLDFAGFRRVTAVYIWIGFGTAVLALGAMFAMEEFRNAFRHAPINIIYVAVVVMAALLAWPAALRAFAQDTVPYWDSEADAARPFRPAVDRGLTALGYLHLWLVVFGFSQWLAATLGMSALGALPGGLEIVGPLPILLGLAVLGLEAWVGVELVGMTERYRLAALTYALGAVAVVLVERLALAPAGPTGDLGDGAAAGARLIPIMETALALILPVVTLALSRART